MSIVTVRRQNAKCKYDEVYFYGWNDWKSDDCYLLLMILADQSHKKMH